jgi:radical SAM superfamily enzyme YgiQ (UPF0313 family)
MKIGLCAVNAKYIHTNLALRYFKNMFSNMNMTLCEYSINETVNQAAQGLFSHNFDIVIFSCYIWNIGFIMKLCEILKKANPNIKIILGGPEVSFETKELMENNQYIDFVSLGEGEANLEDLINHILYVMLQNEIPNRVLELKDIQGIAYREQNKVIVNDGYPVLENMDKLPFPYNDDELKMKDKIFYYETNRGCPFNCSYCLSSVTKGVRAISMIKLQRDLLRFINAGVKLVKFVDRTANYSKSRFIDILKFLKENNKNTTFHFEIAAHLLDEETIEILKEIPKNLIQFEVGVQSTNAETIKSIDRKTDFDRISEMITRIISFDNIHVHMDLIAGLPKEDIKSFEKSFNDLYNLKPHCVQLGFLKLLKGSKLKSEAYEYDIEFASFAPYEVIRTKWISFEELLHLKVIDYLVDKYYNQIGFGNALEYIQRYIYRESEINYFEFWSKFAYYFNEQYGLNKSYSMDTLYNIFYEYAVSKLNAPSDIMAEMLKFDYAKRVRPTAHPKWYKIDIEKEKLLKQNKYKQYRGYDKFIESFEIDVLSAIKTNFKEITFMNNYIEFDYINKMCNIFLNSSNQGE